MKLPAGTDGGMIYHPLDDNFVDDLVVFRGAVEIKTPAGTGFILVDKGRLRAALFRTTTDSYPGASALSFMTVDSDTMGAVRTFHLRTYDDGEFSRALEICRESRLLISDDEPVQPAAVNPSAKTSEPAWESSKVPPEFLDQNRLKKILDQPGVIAVSAFFEGFPVQSMGDADFEHVAASAEDFMRAGVRIAEDMNAGLLDQMILETADYKFIIAPCGDLFLCVFTTADTQLGLIRVLLKGIQSEGCQ